MSRATAAALLAWLLGSGFAQPASADCYPETAEAAKAATTGLRKWPDVYSAFARYGICDDGVVAEGFSDAIASLLAQRWDSVGVFVQLARSHHKFEQFVLRHVDSLMTPEQARMIAHNARFHCPLGAGAICARIMHHALVSSHG